MEGGGGWGGGVCWKTKEHTGPTELWYRANNRGSFWARWWRCAVKQTLGMKCDPSQAESESRPPQGSSTLVTITIVFSVWPGLGYGMHVSSKGNRGDTKKKSSHNNDDDCSDGDDATPVMPMDISSEALTQMTWACPETLPPFTRTAAPKVSDTSA